MTSRSIHAGRQKNGGSPDVVEKLKKGKLYEERHGHLKKKIETIQRVYRVKNANSAGYKFGRLILHTDKGL